MDTKEKPLLGLTFVSFVSFVFDQRSNHHMFPMIASANSDVFNSVAPVI